MDSQNMDVHMEEVYVEEQCTTIPMEGDSAEFCYSVVRDDDDVPSVLIRHSSPFDDTRSFSEELAHHKLNAVWGFEYGKEVVRKTKANVLKYKQQILDKPSFTGAARSSTSNHDFIPLPPMPWADNKEVWKIMMDKEEEASGRRTNRLCEIPNSKLPIMRAVLIDWLTEVCHTYQLKRVSLYLAIDYIDRFLTIKPAVPKAHLQLIGITSLFVAAKIEEIYPPKLKTFSSICDGACTEQEILNCEMLLLNVLGWEVNVMTPPEWLNLYMQIYFYARNVPYENMYRDISSDFFVPHYSGHEFIRLSNLVDLFVLDPGFVNFKYSVIAASTIYFFHGAAAAHRVSGLTWNDLKDCVEYMTVYYTILNNSDDPQFKFSVPCSSCYYCKSVIETYHYLNAGNIQLIMTETFSLQNYAGNMKHFGEAIMLRLEQMGYHSSTVYQENNDDAEYQKLYKVERVTYDAKHANTTDSIFGFCNSSLFNPDIALKFPKILEVITDYASKELISRTIK